MTARWIGRELARLDGRRKVTGAATYAAEVPVAHVAHAVIVGSRIAHGEVTAIDTAEAARAPGVLAVLTHENAPRLSGAGGGKAQPNDRVIQLLQDGAVKYQDQPIALVVADTLERAQHAAALVRARYRETRPVAHLDDDLAHAYAPAPGQSPGGGPDSSRGDVEAGLARAAHRLEATYTTPIETHNPMEPHATIAVWHGRDRLTLYDSTQGIFNVRQRLAAIFGLEPPAVRVINHFVGGGFGGKGAPWSHVALAAMGARVAGRAVKLVVTRPQMQSLVGHRPETLQKVSVGIDARGRLVGLRHDVVSETSRFDEFVERCANQTRMLYACRNVATSHRLVALDIPTPTFMRAPGEAAGTFALESALDEIAHLGGIDPLELRRINHATADPHVDKPWSSKSLLACYAAAAERAGWSRRPPRPRATHEGAHLIGTGMATATRGAPQRPASARATMSADGRALVQAGTQDIGTGTYTIMSQIAADALGLPIDAVRFELGDTTFPETPLSVGSFTAASTGPAVQRACAELRRKLVELAVADPRSPLHGAAAGAIDADDGALVSTADASRRDSYAAIVGRAGQEVTVEAHSDPSKERERYSIYAFGAVFAQVRVDEEIGEIRVDHLVGAFAAGTILNRTTARSQLVGGMVWGLGMALREHSVRDARTARMVTRDLADYHLPVHADVPAIDVILVDERDPWVNELGAKGIGELGVTGVAAAIANAVHHATGVRVRGLPIRCEDVLAGQGAPARTARRR